MASYLIPLRTCEELARVFHSQCCYISLQLRYLLISLIKIKGMQIEDHEIKIVNFADDTTIFLRDITYFTRIQVILKLYEDASSSKINISKAKPYALEHIKLELISKDYWNGHDVPLKYLS